MMIAREIGLLRRLGRGGPVVATILWLLSARTDAAGTVREGLRHDPDRPNPAMAVPYSSWPVIAASSTHTGGSADAPSGHTQSNKTQAISLSGWVTVIWNDRVHYILSDDQGRWTELLLDEEMAQSLGGPLALNHKRAKVVGERMAAPSESVRVLSIVLE
ncbi:MAG: hypothetical protein F9K13_12265 [Candidatus Methylomirabilis oxygeniifera]|nr:MAG: hypothetical protein F9K13_12265 [Candidatus Methylomirabilis oxyfera]